MFFFNDTATTEIYTLFLHDALPIYHGQLPQDVWATGRCGSHRESVGPRLPACSAHWRRSGARTSKRHPQRSEEHTSELQSRQYLVCRLLLEKKNLRSENQTFELPST